MSNKKPTVSSSRLEIKKPLEHHDSISEHPVYGAPGCGLASYSCLLLFFFLVGVSGLVVSSLALFQGQMVEDSYYVRPGHQVQTKRLQPLRDAKVIELMDIPVLYHDESNDGTIACALMEESIVRVDGKQSWKIPYTKLADAVTDNTCCVVRAIILGEEGQSDEQLPCYFEQAEGHTVFLTELKAQIEKSKSK